MKEDEKSVRDGWNEGTYSVASAHREAQSHKSMKGERMLTIIEYVHSVCILRTAIFSYPKAGMLCINSKITATSPNQHCYSTRTTYHEIVLSKSLPWILRSLRFPSPGASDEVHTARRTRIRQTFFCAYATCL